MANTYVDYTATAAQTDFAFSFDYLEDEHVTVEIDGVVQLTSDYSIVTTPSTKVVLNVGATAGQIVRVRRKSQPDTNLVDFVNGSVLTESELDRAYLHNRYLAEEIAELNDASLQIEAGGTQWDAKSLRIKNVDTPTDGTDATNKTYVDTNDALKVAKAGDSMTGELAMGGNKVTGLGTPTATTDASTKDYVDSKVNQVSSGASSPPTKWVFTGTAGANTTYDVTGAEVNGDTAYDVSIDGAVKEPTTDYTVDPDTDTLTIVPTLSGGEDIVVIERGFGVAVTGTVGTSQIQDGAVTAAKISTTDPVFNVQTDGKVGIGTTNPDDLLTLGTADSGTSVISFRTDSNARISEIKAVDTGSGDGQLSLWTRKTGTSYQRITIDSDGKTGIGTASPLSQLHIVAGEDYPLDSQISGVTAYESARFTSTNDGRSIAILSDKVVNSSGYSGSNYLVSLDSGHHLYLATTTALSDPADPSSFTCQVVLTLTEDGKAGIGTKSPNYDLDVVGDVNITGDYKVNGANVTTVPTGTVTAFAGSSAPTGYLLCDGSEYSETTYATLFGVISTTYNTGGETANHFRVPDLRGRVIAGIDSANNVLNNTSSIVGTALGNTGGDDVHLLLSSESGLPDHTHLSSQNSNASDPPGSFNRQISSVTGNATSGVVGGAQDAASAHNNVQPTIILNYIIKI